MANLSESVESDEEIVWCSVNVWRPLSDRSLWLIPADIVILPLVLVLGMVLAAGGRRLQGRREVMLTNRRLLFRQGILNPSITIIDRPDIKALEIFAEDDTVLIHGYGNILHRAVAIGDSTNLARAAGATTVLWRSRLPAQARHYLAMCPFFALAFGIAFPILVTVAAIFYPALIDGTIALIPEPWLPTDMFKQIAAFFGACFVAGNLAGYLFSWILAHQSVAGEDLRAFRCWKFQPLWQGRCPGQGWSTAPTWPFRMFRVALDQLFWGPTSDCDVIEPEVIQPDEWDRFEEDDWQHPIDPNALRL